MHLYTSPSSPHWVSQSATCWYGVEGAVKGSGTFLRAFWAYSRCKCRRRCGDILTPGSRWALEPFQQHIFQTRLWYQWAVSVLHTLRLLLGSNKWNLCFCSVAFSTDVYAPQWWDLESMISIPDMSWGSCCFSRLWSSNNPRGSAQLRRLKSAITHFVVILQLNNVLNIQCVLSINDFFILCCIYF